MANLIKLIRNIFQRGKFPQFLYFINEPDPVESKLILEKLNKQDPSEFDVLAFNGNVRIFYFSEGHYHEIGVRR